MQKFVSQRELPAQPAHPVASEKPAMKAWALAALAGAALWGSAQMWEPPAKRDVCASNPRLMECRVALSLQSWGS